jgi:hypothetical protein
MISGIKIKKWIVEGVTRERARYSHKSLESNRAGVESGIAA